MVVKIVIDLAVVELCSSINKKINLYLKVLPFVAAVGTVGREKTRATETRISKTVLCILLNLLVL